jgi:hypothetical protein
VAETVPRNSPLAVPVGGLGALGASVVQGALEVLVAPEASVALEASVVPAVSVVPGATVSQRCLRAATTGNTTRSIAAERHIATARLRTGLAAQPGAILWPTARLAPGNRLAGKAAICPATARQEPVRVIAPAAQAAATKREEAATGRAQAAATGREAAERIAQVAAISPAAGVETEMHSEGVPRDTADRVRAPAAAAVPRAWAVALVAVAPVVVVAGGADK